MPTKLPYRMRAGAFVRDHAAELAALGAGWRWWSMTTRGTVVDGAGRVVEVADRLGSEVTLTPSASAPSQGAPRAGSFLTGLDFAANDPATIGPVFYTGPGVTMASGFCVAHIFTAPALDANISATLSSWSASNGKLHLRNGQLQMGTPVSGAIPGPDPGGLSWVIANYSPAAKTLSLRGPGGAVSAAVQTVPAGFVVVVGARNNAANPAESWSGLIHDTMFRNGPLNAAEIDGLASILSDLTGV